MSNAPPFRWSEMHQYNMEHKFMKTDINSRKITHLVRVRKFTYLVRVRKITYLVRVRKFTHLVTVVTDVI